MSQVIIGMDPHKRSATIEVMTGDETVVGGGRYGTDATGYRAMLAAVRRWPQRTWATGGCQSIGRHIANRLLAEGETVTDVPPKAVRSHPRLCHRAGPQDRRHRCALGRAGRHPDARPAPGRR
jgi:hypothetical protein